MFLDYFNILILKIICKNKKFYFNIFLNKNYFKIYVFLSALYDKRDALSSNSTPHNIFLINRKDKGQVHNGNQLVILSN
jgi:hypothetical protein